MGKLDWLPSFIYRVKVSCSNRQGSKSNGVIYYRGSRIRQRRRRDLESFLVYSSFKHVYKHNTQTKIQGISFLFFISFFFCLSLFHYIFSFFSKIKREGGVNKDWQWFLLHCICNFLEIIYDVYGSPGGLYTKQTPKSYI